MEGEMVTVGERMLKGKRKGEEVREICLMANFINFELY